jgi:hypothetical protein
MTASPATISDLHASTRTGPGVIVDGYGTGNYLLEEFLSLGVDLIHVQSTPDPITRMVAPQTSKYIETLTYTAGETEAKLAAMDVKFVIPGQEPGVNLADHLSETLGLRTNGTRLSSARRNKAAMTNMVAAAGLLTARQAIVTTPQEATQWAESTGGWPCVAKPLASASSDSVSICFNNTELEIAVKEVLGSNTVFNYPNPEVLIQSYLRGTEYIVDTVSLDGETYVCGVWVYEKTLLPNGKRIYNRDILLDPEKDSVVEAVVAYTLRVIKALKIDNGPGHAEIMMTADGPTLIEIGARTNGNMHPGFHDVCLGTNSASLTAVAYLCPEKFKETLAGQTYRRIQPAVVFNVPTSRSGRIAALNAELLDEIRSRPSVMSVSLKRQPGDDLTPTRDLLTSPARVFMTCADQETLDSDYEFIRSVRERIFILDET